jgi:hypothetical protein
VCLRMKLVAVVQKPQSPSKISKGLACISKD